MSILREIDTVKAYYWLMRCRFHKIIHKPKSNKPYIVILTSFFPPVITGGTYRPAALVRYAREAGWDVIIITNPFDGEVSDAGNFLLDYVGRNLDLYRIDPAALSPSYRFFPRVDGKMLNALSAVDLAIREVKFHPDFVFATGPDFHNFIAAKLIARIFQSKYVLEYRDEWSLCPFEFVSKGQLDKFIEQSCISDSSGLIFTTKSQQQLNAQNFKHSLTSKSIVIPNGWEPSDALDGSLPLELDQNMINIGFLGNLSNHTLPTTFLEQLAKIIQAEPNYTERLKIYFVGQKSEEALLSIASFPFPEILVLVDHVRKPEALKIMQALDGLLLISDKRFRRYLPGKIYDYLASGTPILVFGAGGEIASVITELNSGFVIDDGSVDALADALVKLKSWDQARSRSRVDGFMMNHTRETTSNATLQFLSSL